MSVASALMAALAATFSATAPATPVESPVLWALLAWTRRQYQETLSTVPSAFGLAKSIQPVENQQTGTESDTGALLPRRVIVGLLPVRALFPGITAQDSTGPNTAAPGNPVATRVVVYTNSAGQKVTLSVDLYPDAKSASAAFQEAAEASAAVPGFSPLPSPQLGNEAFAGVVTQGTETHVGIGARYGRVVIGATTAGFAADPSTIARLELLAAVQGVTGSILAPSYDFRFLQV
ncbi:MAG TPA: hypothetical protein VKI00_26495 [Mycobacterium sp.]|uniref:hypothetical protein n=1 Tax=Mycobacterium sp. TaxID=1785 RepID=UPI002B6A9789|nr:hypothetical protein [Mycobacterium sp.]HME79076.1 hypothetical protein [Mycobacterium sp.]